MKKMLNSLDGIKNNTTQLKSNLSHSVVAFNALRKSKEWVSLKTELRNTRRSMALNLGIARSSCNDSNDTVEIHSSLTLKPLAIRRYKEDDTFIMEAIPDIERFLSSIPHSYNGVETIKSMMESEIQDISEAEKLYHETLEKVNQQIMNNEINRVAGNKLSRQAKVLLREQTRAAQTNWRQTEWMGFHFENLVVDSDNPSIGGKGFTFGRTVIDTSIGAQNKIPLDVKFHSMYNKAGRDSVEIPLNSQEAIRACIEEYGAYYILVAKGDCMFDENGSLKKFHNEVKECEPNADPNHKSRVMKSFVEIAEFSIYRVGLDDLDSLIDFKQGKQATGHSRKPKYTMNFGKGGFVPTVKFVTEYGISKGR